MFPQFGATADTLSKASTMVFRIGTDAHLYDDPEDGNILQLLDSKFESEKCEALKRLLALIAQGFDVSNFFPQVVKNVASQYLEVKKLVYLYLLHYAEKRPSEALLSINCFQKDLGDPNPLVRAWALRTMAGIRLHVVAPIVLVAVGKCSRDPSVYVRKCAANALPKLYELQIEENNSSVEEIIGILLNDHSPGVVGAAAAAFATVCPNNFSLIDKSYRRLCQILPDVEEWGQIVLIDILLRYVMAKHGLVKESLMSFLDHSDTSYLDKHGSLCSFGGEENDDLITKDNSALACIMSRSYIEGPDEFLSRSNLRYRGLEGLDSWKYTSYKSNDDVKILLQCTSPLLWSYNSAVVIGAAGVHWIMAPLEDVKRIVKPLLFVLRSSNASRYVVLCNIQVFARAIPSMFAPYFEDFFISCSDTYQIRSLKLDILSSIATVSSISAVLKEFQDYIRDPDRRFAADTISALGICAQRLPTMAEICLDWLLALTRQELISGDFGLPSEEAGVLTQIIVSINSIVKENPVNHEKVIIHLLRKLDSIKVPAARAMIIWMVGEYNSLGRTIPKMLGTILKYLAWCFKSEASEAKLQILIAAVKVLSNSRGEDYLTVKNIVQYVLDLAEFDLNYDIRDRARLLKKLLELNTGSSILEKETKDLAQNSDGRCMLFEKIFGGKLKPVAPEASNRRFYLPGSLSQIVLHAAPSYEPLPKPCSLIIDGPDEMSNNFQRQASKMDDDSEALSGSLDEESASDYSSEQSVTGSTSSDAADIYGNGYASEEEEETAGSADPLIQISETENAPPRKEGGVAEHSEEEIGELMSKTALESWLDEQSSSTNKEMSEFVESTARITLGGNIGSRIKPKSYTLLDPANGNGLKVDYSYSSQVSSISPLLICVQVWFKNCTAEVMSRVTLVDAESVNSTPSSERSLILDKDLPTLIPVEEIEKLDPGETVKRNIQVRFYHHLLPLKLTVVCNEKKMPVKLRPDIGYFVKPLPMDLETFTKTQSRLPGMFEYERRCNFIDHLEEFKGDGGGLEVKKDKLMVICESIALKMLGSSNLFAVSMDMPVESKLDDATGLCLRFSCEILSASVPCLITVVVEGKCSDPIDLSLKVNCEDTVFALNLLNRLVNFLVEEPPHP